MHSDSLDTVPGVYLLKGHDRARTPLQTALHQEANSEDELILSWHGVGLHAASIPTRLLFVVPSPVSPHRSAQPGMTALYFHWISSYRQSLSKELSSANISHQVRRLH